MMSLKNLSKYDGTWCTVGYILLYFLLGELSYEDRLLILFRHPSFVCTQCMLYWKARASRHVYESVYVIVVQRCPFYFLW